MTQGQLRFALIAICIFSLTVIISMAAMVACAQPSTLSTREARTRVQDCYKAGGVPVVMVDKLMKVRAVGCDRKD